MAYDYYLRIHYVIFQELSSILFVLQAWLEELLNKNGFRNQMLEDELIHLELYRIHLG